MRIIYCRRGGQGTVLMKISYVVLQITAPDGYLYVARQTDKFITSDRAIRQLVTLADRVEDLVSEWDWHIMECADSAELREPTEE